jgi:hypothetical protein
VLGLSLFWIVFRIFHITAGVLWVGSAFLFVGFIGPSAAEVGPAAGPLLSVVVRKRRVTTVITWLAITTVAAGWIMWIAHAVDLGLGDWLSSSYGIVLSIGAVLGSIAAYEGYYYVGRNVERLVGLGEELAAAGGPPPPEKVAEMQKLQGEMKTHGQLDLVLLLITVLCMATARYW